MGANKLAIKTLRGAANYISELERKVLAFEAITQRYGQCPLADVLGQEITDMISESERGTPPKASELGSPPEASSSSGNSKSTPYDDVDEIWYWEGDAYFWDGEDWCLRDEPQQGDEEDDAWTEDAQPPGDHLRRAAWTKSFHESPKPALPAPAPERLPPSQKMISTTHRAEWMRLVLWLQYYTTPLKHSKSTHAIGNKLPVASSKNRLMEKGALTAFPECHKLASGTAKDTLQVHEHAEVK